MCSGIKLTFKQLEVRFPMILMQNDHGDGIQNNLFITGKLEPTNDQLPLSVAS